MATLTLNLFNLGARSRSEITLRRSEDGSTALISFGGHCYTADWERFGRENFTCPLDLVD